MEQVGEICRTQPWNIFIHELEPYALIIVIFIIVVTLLAFMNANHHRHNHHHRLQQALKFNLSWDWLYMYSRYKICWLEFEENGLLKTNGVFCKVSKCSLFLSDRGPFIVFPCRWVAPYMFCTPSWSLHKVTMSCYMDLSELYMDLSVSYMNFLPYAKPNPAEDVKACKSFHFCCWIELTPSVENTNFARCGFGLAGI